MIEIRTTELDAFAHLEEVNELAPGIFQDRQTGELFVTDGRQTIRLTITAE